MAPQPMLRPDPSDPPRSIEDEFEQNASDQEVTDPGLQLTRLANTLASHGGGASSPDLALDLVLNEIVEQARLATSATGAAIALARGPEMICRATSGSQAPGLGVRFNMRSGLSGACVESREAQRCDDTFLDPRLDALASRVLGIRSVLVVPILRDGELAGIFEIFSPRPGAFGNRDVQTLNALSRRIVSNLRHAAEVAASDSEQTGVEGELTLPSPDQEGAVPEDLRTEVDAEPVLPPATARKHDYWTDVLTVIVIGLAVLLGWMIAQVGWRTRSVASQTESLSRPSLPPAISQTTSASAPGSVPIDQAAERTPVVPEAKHRTNKPAISQDSQPPPGGLVVYDKGQVIFRMAPRQELAADASKVSQKSDAPASIELPVSLSPENADKLLLRRVQPEYPALARQQQIEGTVLLQVLVGVDGGVREVNATDGDARLVPAATAAVRQWQFRPYAPQGSPVPFKTQVEVKFSLPSLNPR